MDYTRWVDKATSFLKQIRGRRRTGVKARARSFPPLTAAAVSAIERKIDRAVPKPIRSFWINTTSGFDFRYEWSLSTELQEQIGGLLSGQNRLYGGARLCAARDIATLLTDCSDWANSTWIADSNHELRLWESAFPFCALRNGDFLALDCRKKNDDPPVIYLSHEETSERLCPDLAAFLKAWEGLCYIGPEIWMLRPFIDRRTGRLDRTGTNAKRIRDLFLSAGKFRRNS